jgi:hypothetical protein
MNNNNSIHSRHVDAYTPTLPLQRQRQTMRWENGRMVLYEGTSDYARLQNDLPGSFHRSKG